MPDPHWLRHWLLPLLGIMWLTAVLVVPLRAIRGNDATRMPFHADLVEQLRQSAATQQAMLDTMGQLAQQHDRYLTLLERLTELEQKIQVLTEHNTLALYHLIRTAEVAVYVASLPHEQKPVMSPPTSWYQWLKDAQDQEE